MKSKIVMFIGILLVFSACSKKDYKAMYNNQEVPFLGQPNTIVEQNVQTMQRGENPMARPSYQEYQESMKDKKFEPQ